MKRKVIFMVLVVALFIGFFGSAIAQEEGDSVGQNIYMPIQQTVPHIRFCTDYNRDNQCGRFEFFFPTVGTAIVAGIDLYEITDLEASGWVRHGLDCRINPYGCSAQGVRISGLRCWKSEPTAVDEGYIEIPMQEVSGDQCYLEVP